MFGLPSAYYLDDALRQHREAASRRTSAATFPASASKSVPVSRIPSRATSRRPSLAGLEEPSETSQSGAATGSTIPRSAEDFVDVITRSFSSFLAPTVKSQPPAPPGLKEEQISKPSTSPSPGKGKGKARAIDEDQDVQDATSEDRNSGPSSRRVSPTAERNVTSEKDILSQTKATLLFCKSQVFVHPSKKRDDNISGYLGLASVRSSRDDAEGSMHMTGSDERRIVIFWIPSSLAEALDEEQSYRLVSDRADKVVKGMAADHKDQSTSEVSTSHDVDEGYIVITLPIAATPGQAGYSPVEGMESRCFSPSPSLSSKSSLHRPSANSIKDYPSINADNNDNSRTDASSLLLVSEGGDLIRNEFTADGERQRDQSGGESARKMEEQRRHREMDYAWSVPLEEVYSLLVYQPNIGSWYGSITINLLGGVSMPSLYFHDEESPTALEILKTSRSSASLASTLSTVNSTPNSVTSPKVPWGATPLFSALRGHADILRSRLEPRLFLVNPSRADREVHEIDLGSSVENDRAVPRARTSGSDRTVSSGARAYPPRATFPDAAKNAYSNSGDDFPAATFLHPTRTQLLSGFSQLTQKAKKITQDILSQPFAEPIVTHLPAPVRDLVQPGQAWESKKKNGRNVAGEFESARVYLARWARVVAEEGERSRKAELAATARISSGGHRSDSEAKSDLGIFELVRNNRSDGQVPATTRTPGNPVTLEAVLEWHANGFDESHLRKETFRRGVEAGEARQLVWEVLLGVIDWKLGLGQETKEAQAKWNTLRDQQSVEYYDLQNKWQNSSHQGDDKEREEWHRIDVDCRRTDRNQPMFAIPDALKGEEEKEGGGAARSSGSIPLHVEEGSQTALNPHVAALRTILMTYHAYSPDLGYVQGMSDLLSPIYVVYEGDESRSFWVFCGWMKTMDVNFLRDQSGMKQKLSTLQQLISVMDPQLYRKLERTNCTSMFICFRWLLIAFKREFKFGEVIKLWDVLFARYYSDSFDQFIALAILHSHREVIIRYLVEFDEVLKYANDLSETIDLQSTMAQAEVLFLSFRGLVEEIDRNEIVRAGTAQEEAGHVRSRRSSVSTIASEPKRDLVSDELRELLLNAGSKNNL